MSETFNNYIKIQLGLDQSETIRVEKINKGSSNLTFFLNIGPLQYVLRMPPKGKTPKSGHNMQREYLTLEALSNKNLLVPKVYHYCDNSSLIGAPFFLMEKVEGPIPRKKFHSNLNIDRQKAETISQNFIATLAQLHDIKASDLTIPGFAKRPTSYRSRQITGWIKRFHASKNPLSPSFRNVINYLEQEFPGENPNPTLVHNDFKLDNLVFDKNQPEKIKAILDWELSTIGCPLMDLGSTLAYWVENSDPWYFRSLAIMPTREQGMFSRNQLIQYYFKTRNLPKTDMSYFYIFGLFKLAVIAQQIFYRYYNGQTRNKRFATYIIGIYSLNFYIQSLIRERK